MNRSYRVALICGAFPLLIGISIFTFWLITRWSWLELAGIYTLYGGAAIFLVGVFALARYCWLAFRTPNIPRRHLWFSTLACAGLLLLNFPVAGGITVAAIAIETRYTVVVHNASDQSLESVRVFGGGCDEPFGTIPPGGIVRQSFWIEHDGELKFSAISYAKIIDGYVTHGSGGHTTVTINSDGTISGSSGR